MRITIHSDLHIFSPINLPYSVREIRDNATDSDTLLLLGDVGDDPRLLASFVDSAKSSYSDIIVVPGNHDYCQSVYTLANEEFLDHFAGTNVHFLQDGASTRIGDVLFTGGTLWTDYHRMSPQWLVNSAGTLDVRNINDLHFEFDLDEVSGHLGVVYPEATSEWKEYILKVFSDKNEDMGLSVSDTVPFSKVHQFFYFLRTVSGIISATTASEVPTKHQVVATHFAPSVECNKGFRDFMNRRYPGRWEDRVQYFCSDLHHVIERIKPTLWAYGHLHVSKDFALNGTRLVSNCVGFPREDEMYNSRYNNYLTIELD